MQLQELYGDIAKLYYSNGSGEAAFEFYLLAGKEETALNILKDIFRDNFQQSNFEKLWNYVSAFSGQYSDRDKHLQFYMGILLKYYKGSIEEALVSLNRAIEIDETEPELKFFISCTHLKAEILLTLGKGRINEAIDILNSVLSEKASPLENAKTYHLLGNAYFNINKPDISESFLEKALAICGTEPSTELEHDIYSLLGNIKIIKGDFVQSHHYYELALNKTNGLFKKIVILGNLTVLYSRSGKFTIAWDSLNKSKELLTKFRTPIFELIVKMSEYALWFEMGDYNSGLKLASEIKEMALRSNSSNYIFLSYQFLGECSYYSGNPVKAIEFYHLSRKFIDESNEADEILLSLLIAVSKIKQELTEDTETKLLRAYTYLDAINSNYDKTIAGYYLAAFYHERGNTDTAAKYFEKTLELASEKEYNSFLLREYLFSDKLFTMPDSSSIHRNIIRSIRLNILEVSESGWINNEYRTHLKNFIDGNYDIKMNIFGGVEFFVKNEPVAESLWKRKKRKLILCCLLLNRGNHLSKDRIIDLFFRESSIENSDNLFHQAISNIRSALKSASNTGNETSERQYIVYEGKQLKIAPGISIFSDASEFERLLEKVSAAEDTAIKTDLLKIAVNLYKGEALEGFYEPWCEQVRSEFRTKFIKACEMLLTNLFKAEQYDEAEIYSEKLLQSEPFNETANVISINSLYRSGKSVRAKEKLSELRSLYKTELNENIPAQLERKFSALFE
jgi:two-component SAPR family response regulator